MVSSMPVHGTSRSPNEPDTVFEGNGGAPPRRREVKKTKLFIVLPAYNEEENLGALLEAIDNVLQEQNLDYQVIVIDDGSRDHTLRILEQYREQVPLTICRHELNQGLGPTIRDGLLVASGMAADSDVVITMDADQSHTPGLIIRMIQMLHEGHDVVIASRYRRGARVFGVSLFRRCLSYGASMLFRIVFPTSGVRDYTCGYRAYRGNVLRRAITVYGDRFVEVSGFQCMIDILLKLRGLDVIFGEVPMVLRYDLKRGESKMPIFRTIRHSLTLLIRRRLGT